MNHMVRVENDRLLFEIPYFLNYKAKSCGARFSRTRNLWQCRVTRLSIIAVINNFDEDVIHPDIFKLAPKRVELPDITEQDFHDTVKGVTLRDRQLEGIMKMWRCQSFALFWSMGAGKSLASIAVFNNRVLKCGVDAILILAPASVRGVWPKEINRYSAIDYHVQILESGVRLKEWEGRPVLVASIESLSQGSGYEKLESYLKQYRNPMIILDESSRIKNIGAVRTKRALDLSYLSSHKIILTGTSITRGLEDLYSQMAFVDPGIIGEISYYSFRNKYCVLGGYGYNKIIGYSDADKLLDKIRPHCDIVKKNEILGLPERNFQIRNVKANKDQKIACYELKNQMETEINDKEVKIVNYLGYMLRAQQIAGGFDPDGNQIGNNNPKLTELLSILEDTEDKTIIWASFLPEINAIASAISAKYGNKSVVKIVGETGDKQAVADAFQEDPDIRFIIANPSTGGIGLTLTAATLAVYYSNSFNFEVRMQSLDRNHRIGSLWPTTYIDLRCDIAIDSLILRALQNKKDVSDFVQDGLKPNDIF